MQFVHLALDLYFAALFSVSGVAKVKDLGYFALVLEKQQIVPRWSIRPISRMLPLGEILLALLLAFGFMPRVTAILVVTVCLTFLAIEAQLLTSNSDSDCGCYGATNPHRATQSSVLTSGVITMLAITHLLAVFAAPVVEMPLRIAGVFVLSGFVAWCVWRMVKIPQSAQQPDPQFASRLREGDYFPLDLGIVLPEKAFLVFVGANCQYCDMLCRDLEDVALGAWSLIVIVVGTSSDEAKGTVIPSSAHVLYDTKRVWFADLGLFATPTIMVLSKGRIVAQTPGASIRWFIDIDWNHRAEEALRKWNILEYAHES